MKRLIGSALFAMVMCSYLAVAFANSGPVFWQGYPSVDIMAIAEDTPIRVDRENLVFDFSQREDNNFSYGISGKVTATYQMVNPTADMQSVKMAFPFVESVDRLLHKDIVINADDEILPYEVYLGDVVYSYGDPRQDDRDASFDFASIVSTITDEPYQAKKFRKNEKGKLYSIAVSPTTDQGINFAIDFIHDHEKTNIYTNGLFNRYQRDKQKTRIAAWCYEPQTLEIFVLGEDLDLDINVYTDGELKQKTDLFTYKISTQEVEVGTYLLENIISSSRGKNEGLISDTQLYNVYSKALDEYLTMNLGYSSEYDILAQDHYERVLSLVYNVDFPPNSEKEVRVSYRTSGTMDKRKTAQPLYSFDYILNPAKNWSGFKNINIEIIPPQEAPYLVDSSIEFLQGEDNVYTASLAELPEGDLFFTLYESESVTMIDKIDRKLKVVAAITLITIGVLTVVILNKKYKNNG